MPTSALIHNGTLPETLAIGGGSATRRDTQKQIIIIYNLRSLIVTYVVM